MESAAVRPSAMSAIRGLPLRPQSESAGRHRRTPWPLLSRMESESGRGARPDRRPPGECSSRDFDDDGTRRGL